MDVTPLVPKGQQIIQSYAQSRFKVSGETYDSAIIVSPERTVAWDVHDVDTLQVDDFSSLIACKGQHDVVLLGVGKTMMAIPAELRLSLKKQGLNVDFMDTGAACRTYNVLMAEGRRVVCALLPA
ncbi:MAG: Mth938-like domain-containing protein [Alphaproteobacteria bacterium]